MEIVIDIILSIVEVAVDLWINNISRLFEKKKSAEG